MPAQSIFKTLCYFDTLSRPLTAVEIFKWLDAPSSLGEVLAALDSLKISGALGEQNGFYFLPGREAIVAERFRRYGWSWAKFKRARRAIARLSRFPWVRAVAVYSSLSFFNCRQESDIDLFVVAAPGRVWSARFFLTLYLKLFRLRPTDVTARDKFCLSFLVDENNLDLSPAVAGASDWHYIFSHSQFLFFSGAEDLIKRFFVANQHVAKNFPNWRQPQLVQGKKITVGNSWAEKILALPEKFYHSLQLRLLPRRVKFLVGQGQSVIVTDTMIKLHHNDKRQIFNTAWEQNYQKYSHGAS